MRSLVSLTLALTVAAGCTEGGEASPLDSTGGNFPAAATLGGSSGLATGGRTFGSGAASPLPSGLTGGSGGVLVATGGQPNTSTAGASNGSGGTHGVGGSAPGSAGGMAPVLSFNACKAASASAPCIILPLGDSITDGYSASDGGGYRAPLFHLALVDQKHITFIGSGSGGPALVDGVPFPDRHEGHSGAAIDNLSVYTQTGELKPNIVLIMAGTNGCDNEAIDIGVCMEGLLDAAIANQPNALIVVAKVTPTNPDRLGDLNSKIPGLVAARVAQGKHIVLADLYSRFLSNPNYATDYLVDGGHPNDAGYRVMADGWYEVIKPYLN